MKDTPLQVKIENDELVIRIGIDTLAHAAENCLLFYDNMIRIYPPYVKVVDKIQLAKDIKRELNREKEDGSTPLNVLLDECICNAYEDGSLAFDMILRRL